MWARSCRRRAYIPQFNRWKSIITSFRCPRIVKCCLTKLKTIAVCRQREMLEGHRWTTWAATTQIFFLLLLLFLTNRYLWYWNRLLTRNYAWGGGRLSYMCNTPPLFSKWEGVFRRNAQGCYGNSFLKLLFLFFFFSLFGIFVFFRKLVPIWHISYL